MVKPYFPTPDLLSPRIDGGTDSSTSHLATVSHPPRGRLPVCMPDRGRDLADLLVRDRVEGCDLAVPPPSDESPCPGNKDAVEEEDCPRRRRRWANERLEGGGWEGSEGEARAAAADQIARTTGHGSSKRWKKDSTGAVRHSAHRLDLLCGVAVPSARNGAAVCFPG
jgi:hypothetical protein